MTLRPPVPTQVKPGGLYVVEDAHTSKQDGYDVQDGNDLWTLLRTYEATGAIRSNYMTPHQATTLEAWLQEVRCYVILDGHSETCVFQKRTRPRDAPNDAPVLRVHHGDQLGITSRILDT